MIEFADGVIVASRLVDLLRETPEEGRLEAVRDFIGSLRDALYRTSSPAVDRPNSLKK